MISIEMVEAIEESTTGMELFDNIIEAFSGYGFGNIDSPNIVIPYEITKEDYQALPQPDETNYIYLVTNY